MPKKDEKTIITIRGVKKSNRAYFNYWRALHGCLTQQAAFDRIMEDLKRKGE